MWDTWRFLLTSYLLARTLKKLARANQEGFENRHWKIVNCIIIESERQYSRLTSENLTWFNKELSGHEELSFLNELGLTGVQNTRKNIQLICNAYYKSKRFLHPPVNIEIVVIHRSKITQWKAVFLTFFFKMISLEANNRIRIAKFNWYTCSFADKNSNHSR